MRTILNRIKARLGFVIIAAVWGVLLGLLAFFAVSYAIYADLKSPRSSRLIAGTGAESIATRIYGVHFMPMWQSDPNCVQFDPELVYVPKPGVARFSALEFDTRITITSEGVRQQPELSKDARDTIVLTGDSLTFGWGVGDEETFSVALQREHRHRTINTAVPSYGTARELFRLRRLGLLAGASVIVIQYCRNDAPENQAFLRDAGGFFTSRNARASWQELMHYQPPPDVTYGGALTELTRYLRARWAFESLPQFTLNLLTEEKTDPPRRDSIPGGAPVMADEFLRVLDCFPELAGKPVIVTELDGFWVDTGFLRELRKRSMGRPNLTILSLRLQPEDFFRFDPHLSPRGHRSVAAQLDGPIRKALSRAAGSTP